MNCDRLNPTRWSGLLWQKYLKAGILSLAAVSVLSAQTDDVSNDDIYELEAFEVNAGFAGSLAAAAEMKKVQPVIVEMVVAEDIGKLPDASIAESLARLPGLTTQRINSRAQGIVIRGLTGDFSTALLNGRQQVSTSGDRSVEFDQYPAELLNGVAVYKTGTASLIGQGLAGTINMQTLRPLALDHQLLAVNARYQMVDLGKLNPDSEDTGYRYTLNYADQFLDDTLGIAFGYSYTDQAGQGEQFEAWGYPTVDDNYVIGGMKPFIRSSEFERSSIMGVVEYRPSRKFHAVLDIFVSDFNETQKLRGLEIPMAQWSSAQLQPGYTVENGLVTRGVLENVYMVMRNDEVWRDADVANTGLNMVFGEAGDWQFEIDLNRSFMKRKDNVLETYSGWASNQVGTPDTVAFEMTGIGIQLDPALDYTSNQIMLTSAQGWGGDRVPGGQVGFFKGPKSEDELFQYRASVYKEFDHSWMRKLDFGVAYTDRNKFETEAHPEGYEGWFLALPNGATSAALPPSVGVTDLSFIGIDGQYSYNARSLWENGYYDTIVNDNINLLANNYDVTEKITTFYAQMEFEKEVGERTLVGNIGAQMIHSDQSSVGVAANGTDALPVTGEHTYWDFVPSLNLIYNIDEDQKIRLSITRQLARQEMVDFRADSTYGFNETLYASTDPQESPWSGSGGNPELEPWRSNSIDLTYELYFKDSGGYFAVNGFYKDLVSYTYNEQTLMDFTGYDTNSSLVPAIYEGYRSVPVNGDGGSIHGLETTLSLTGDLVSDSLKGFGVILSASFTESNIETSPGNTQPIPGLSETVINGTLYYEKAGFAARVSARHRSDYRGDISTFGPRGENYRTLKSETVVDAQIGYTFQEGSKLEGFSVTLQGSNLTDEPLFGYDNGDERLVRNYQLWGAEYTLGVSYKF